MVTGIRGLCNGLGPAMYGLIFYLFHVDLNEQEGEEGVERNTTASLHGMDVSVYSAETRLSAFVLQLITSLMPGPPFVFGSLLVLLAILVAAFIPSAPSRAGGWSGAGEGERRRQGEGKRRSDDSYEEDSEREFQVIRYWQLDISVVTVPLCVQMPLMASDSEDELL